MLKISIAGNCQLNPLYYFLKKYYADFFDIELLSIFTCSSEDVKKFQHRVSTSDILINTLTTETYRNDIGLGSKFLSSLLPKHGLSLVVPCLYYTGYFPTSSSFYNLDSLIYNADIDDLVASKYHDYIPIILAQHGITNLEYANIEARCADNQAICELIIENHVSSIQELQKREAECNISVSVDILETYQSSVVFLTYNHPDKPVLYALYQKIIDHIISHFNLPISYSVDRLMGLNDKDKILVYNFILKALGSKIHISYNTDMYSNALSTIVKYYMSQQIGPSNTQNKAYHISYRLLQLSGIL